MTEEKTECGCVDSCLHKPNCVFETPATREIERLRVAMREACDLLAERTYGSEARSPGHNARLKLEAALKTAQDDGYQTLPDGVRVKGPGILSDKQL
jgi:hypothetical protein